MEQEPVPLMELLAFLLFLGSLTFLTGAGWQGWILYRNKKNMAKSLAVVILTRTLTISSSFVIWWACAFPGNAFFLFLFLPALVPELLLSPIVLKLSGNEIFSNKKSLRGHS